MSPVFLKNALLELAWRVPSARKLTAQYCHIRRDKTLKPV